MNTDPCQEHARLQLTIAAYLNDQAAFEPEEFRRLSTVIGQHVQTCPTCKAAIEKRRAGRVQA